MARMLVIVALAAALLAAGCGGDDDDGGMGEPAASSEPEPAAEPAPEATGQADGEEGSQQHERSKGERPQGTKISTADSQFGEVLFDGDDQAIYYFDEEDTSEAECYGECAAAWPPVLTEGGPQAAGQAEQGLLGTTKRDDGSTQVTYAGRPLYYYRDEGPGELRCHNVFHAGGLWLAVLPDGDAVPT